ncbi:MAG: hypothetical protein DWB99_00145 [Candidatus Poseidoniales archaeon]|nr:MAG: hypothetical protein DWB99_00145 [Candidatus Poseidoniales archaeon]|tara:strand:+ start:8796 stop:10151 length:1356 start_codon:yes stop_codon:yes gene_type:complete
MENSNDQVVEKFTEAGLEEKHAKLIIDLACHPPSKASEIGKRVGVSRMDAYNSLRKLQEQGLVKATLDKPIRFFGMRIEEVFQQIIRIKEMDLRRIQHNLENLSSNSEIPIMSVDQTSDEDTFSVLKDRHTIMATIESVVAESEEQIWLLLGRWGILHLLRSGAKDAIEEAINRGVDVKIVACIDKKTIRFFDSLNDRIEVRHHEDFNLNGVFVDEEVGIQFVHTEDTPTGRGKEDTAILIESGMLLTAQSELLKIQWRAAKSYHSIRSKILDGVMTEPLRLSLGEGSFYEHFRTSLQAGMSPKPTSNAVLRKNGSEVKFGNELENETLSALGIDSAILFEHIGSRIGEELAVKLQHISDDSLFWETIIQEWSEMGMGEIEIDKLPPTKIIVKDGSACGGNPNTSKFFCNLDESVLSGILMERHGRKVSTSKRECMETKNCSCFYEINFEE